MPFEAFSRRLHRFYEVSKSDLHQLEQMTCRESAHAPRAVITARGDAKNELLLVRSGWAARCRYTQGGERQIIHVLLPGDLITPDVIAAVTQDHEVIALNECHIRAYERDTIQHMLVHLPQLAAGMLWSMAQEEGMLREQVVRLGRRSALERVCHLLLELYRRLEMVSLAGEERMPFPMTQVEVADTLGLSPVHINRTLRQLVRMGYIEYDGREIALKEIEGLAELGDFDTRHLHLDATVGKARGG